MLKKLIILAVLFLSGTNVFGQTIDSVRAAWVKRYNGPGNFSDYGYTMAVDNSGHIYVTGKSWGAGTNMDYATIKYKPDGDTAWVRRYDGTGSHIDEAASIAVDSSGNVYVTGKSFSGSNDDYATIKYHSNGDTAWVRRYNGPGNSADEGHEIAVDDSGNVYVTGLSTGIGSGGDYATIKYRANGDTAWVSRYNGPGNGGDNAVDIALDNSGNAYVTGWVFGINSTRDYATIKYYPNGDTAWIRRYNGTGNNEDWGMALTVDSSSSVYVTGYSYNGTDYDWATIKYKPDGDTAWIRRYGGTVGYSDEAYAVAVDDAGNVYVTGYSFDPGTNDDYATIKYKPNGDTAWVRRYNGPDNLNDGGTALVLDRSRNVYVTGMSRSISSYSDYLTLKYDQSGNLLWLQKYNGPGDSIDYPNGIAIDDSGSIYVTGESYSSSSDLDYATIKYSEYKIRTDTLKISVYSPVDLIVTDPNSDSIGVNFNTIMKGSTYDSTLDLDGDGDRDDRVTIPNPIAGQYMIRVVAEPGGSGTYTEAIKLDGNEATVVALDAQIPGPGQVDTVLYNVPEYLHGDVNRDGKKTVSDVVFLINYLFKGGIAPDPVNLGDANFCQENPPVDPSKPTVADVVYMVNYLFKGGKPPCS